MPMAKRSAASSSNPAARSASLPGRCRQAPPSSFGFRRSNATTPALDNVSVASFAPASQTPTPQVTIRRFQPDQPLARARRAASVSADLEGLGAEDVELDVTLSLPAGVAWCSPTWPSRVRISIVGRMVAADMESRSRRAHDRGSGPRTQGHGRKPRRTSAAANALSPAGGKILRHPTFPEPKPVPTSMLIGAHHCPLWEADKPQMWDNVLKHPERTPALGFYSQENPEVADWETKWAVEHGISFFVYCWYRTSQGGAVKTQFGSAIHDALFKSRFVDKMKFTIMWENQTRGTAGVADEQDLMTNLLPFWMENYFKHPSYLKIDNKPVLFIYRPEFLVAGPRRRGERGQGVRRRCARRAASRVSTACISWASTAARTRTISS